MSDPADEDAPRAERRAMHDMGGVARYMCEPIDTVPHELTESDRTVDAIRQIVGRKGVMSVDELRRGIEALPEDAYLRLSYYQRWLQSMAGTLLQKGIFSADELRAALEQAR